MADDAVAKAQEEVDVQTTKIAFYAAQQVSIRNGMARRLVELQAILTAAQNPKP